MNDENPIIINVETLDDGKALKIIQIDKRTAELITDGFVYDGETFSMNLASQLNWAGLGNGEINQNIDYPFRVSCKNGSNYYIPNTSEAKDLFWAAVDHKTTHLDSGAALKDAVNEATNQTELDAVVDTR